MNGEQLASYQYDPDSKVLSEGPGKGEIGNNSAWTRWEKGAFSGVIDEVAFYDFALPAFTLQQHVKQVR
ncbi:hypothetical protein [Paraglaciecola algarum]|uniref:hypothetical protein n=1 Tax=Paraglaciecola algarum TaxID=3050085 RepID=UPI0032EA5066